ncbi:hypothetical protein ACJX0J_017417, partial [Zea mays]
IWNDEIENFGILYVAENSVDYLPSCKIILLPCCDGVIVINMNIFFVIVVVGNLEGIFYGDLSTKLMRSWDHGFGTTLDAKTQIGSWGGPVSSARRKTGNPMRKLLGLGGLKIEDERA